MSDKALRDALGELLELMPYMEASFSRDVIAARCARARTALAQPPAAPVQALRSWIDERIAECRRQELKFGSGNGHGRPSTAPMSQTLFEAAAERRALQAVLERL